MTSKINILKLDVIVTINSTYSAEFGRKDNMSKTKKNVRVLLLTLIAIVASVVAIVVNVSAKTEKKECLVEKNIYATAKNYALFCEKDCAKIQQNYYIVQFNVEDDKALGIFLEDTNDCLQAVYERPEYINCDEDNVKYTSSEYELPQVVYQELELAKELARLYVRDSLIIKAQDKEKIYDVIDNLKVHYVEIDDQESEFKETVPMFTKGIEIFVNDNVMTSVMIDYRSLLHELVHVISNVTNDGTKYENSFYNHNMITEALTEYITKQIIEVYGDGSEDERIYQVSYDYYIECVSALMGKADIYKAYFYSDYFDEIFTNVNFEALRFLYLYLDASDISVENKISNWIYIWDLV